MDFLSYKKTCKSGRRGGMTERGCPCIARNLITSEDVLTVVSSPDPTYDEESAGCHRTLSERVGSGDETILSVAPCASCMRAGAINVSLMGTQVQSL